MVNFSKIFSSPLKVVHGIVAAFIVCYTCLNIKSLGYGEWMTLIVFWGTLLIAWLGWKRDLTGYFLAGIIYGVVIEFITEAYWEYKEMHVFLFPQSIFHDRDLSFLVMVGWGYHFTFLTLISNWVFCKITKVTSDAMAFTPTIIVCDGLTGTIWLTVNEILGMKLNLWNYNVTISKWQPTIHIPLLDIFLSWEAILGAGLLAMIVPTFLRHWEKSLRFGGAKSS